LKSPFTSEPFKTFAEVTAFAAIFLFVTAAVFSCAGPTLFFGSARTAA
jgi:hypothetical protein